MRGPFSTPITPLPGSFFHADPQNPDYIGQAPGQNDGFELIGEIPHEQAIILVAIKLRVDRAGRYIVASTYPIDRNKLERRLRKGFIKPA